MNLGAPEMLIVFAVVMLLFGSTKLPALARSLGEARREFEGGSKRSRQAPATAVPAVPAPAAVPAATAVPAAPSEGATTA